MWRAPDPWSDVVDALLSQMSQLQLDCMEAQAGSVALTGQAWTEVPKGELDLRQAKASA
jgi:hypothetical protein